MVLVTCTEVQLHQTSKRRYQAQPCSSSFMLAFLKSQLRPMSWDGHAVTSTGHYQRRVRYAVPNHVNAYVVQFSFSDPCLTPDHLRRDVNQLKCIATASFGITPCAMKMSTSPCSGSMSFLGRRS